MYLIRLMDDAPACFDRDCDGVGVGEEGGGGAGFGEQGAGQGAFFKMIDAAAGAWC